jgi:prevent-host-death family protein
MPKTVSATEAKTNFGAMMAWTVAQKEPIIVQSHGQPKAAIIGYEEYTHYLAMKEKERRQKIWEEMEALRKEVSARNTDLSEEEIYALADRFTNDVFNEMIAEGKIQYGAATDDENTRR